MQHEFWPTLSIMGGGGIHRCDRLLPHSAEGPIYKVSRKPRAVHRASSGPFVTCNGVARPHVDRTWPSSSARLAAWRVGVIQATATRGAGLGKCRW
jgi:hypothetical protein